MTVTMLQGDVVDDVRRREFLGILAAAGLLVGCGEDAPLTTTSAAPGFPRAVAHGEGTTELEAPPEKIYTFGGFALDTLLALGVVPVCYQAFQPELLPWQRLQDMAAVPSVEDGIDAERLATLGADFAMLTNVEWEEPSGQQVRSFCPSITPVQPTTTQSLLTLWGKILGREADAADLVAGYERDIADLAVPTDLSVALVYPLESGVYVYQRDLQATQTLELGGFDVKRFAAAGDVSFELSLERLGELDTDALVLIQPYGPDPAAEALQTQPLFQSLPAVAAGRFVALDMVDSAALLFPTTLALPTVGRLFDRLRGL